MVVLKLAEQEAVALLQVAMFEPSMPRDVPPKPLAGGTRKMKNDERTRQHTSIPVVNFIDLHASKVPTLPRASR
ncbi:MAG TPA: hypothetical protein VN949_03710 [Candidatus Limnocylindrales bacterium]|nr:hypothetical protein [Candidatus Limnocylindrales bacterium]